MPSLMVSGSVVTVLVRLMAFQWHLGHAGHETADYAACMLPGLIQQRIASILERNSAPSPSLISDVLKQTISDFDKNIGDALLHIFPDKLALMDMHDDDVKSTINDDGPMSSIVLRCMRGSTALISITDPSNANLWVASLGDSAASKFRIKCSS